MAGCFQDVFKKCIDFANENYDGHFTLLKFTTNWAFCFGTLYVNNDNIWMMAKGKTPEEAMDIAMKDNINADTINMHLKEAKEDDRDISLVKVPEKKKILIGSVLRQDN